MQEKTKEKIKILISDTHFGIRQNSRTWLESQTAYFENDLFPFIKSLPMGTTLDVCLLGDIFDNRSSIDTRTAQKVVQLLKALYINIIDKNSNNKLIILAGNHDYYSPDEHHVIINNINHHISPHIPNATYVTTEPLLIDDDLYIPWFWMNEDTERLKKLLANTTAKRIFTHTDLSHLNGEIYLALKRFDGVYSGHIHTPFQNDNLYCIGSCFQITMTDANKYRGYWILRNGKLTIKPNNHSIRLWRWTNEDIFKQEIDDNLHIYSKRCDIAEIYVNKDKLSDFDYINRIKLISKHFKYPPQVIPISDIFISENDISELENYNIDTICEEQIPERLLNKFYIIKSENK